MRSRVASLLIAGLTVVVLVAGASSALATPTKSGQCSGCHGISSAVAVVATEGSNNGSTATYNVSVSNAYGDGVTGWAVFSGTTNIFHGNGPGTFTVPVGKSYKVWGVAGSGGEGSNSVTISPIAPPISDTVAPLVAITGPANGSEVSGSVAIGANASDVGSGVNRVEFRVDGVMLASDTTAPYLAVWNASTANLGPHVIEVVAYDNATLSAKTSVEVVAIAPPSPPAGSVPVVRASAPAFVAYSAQATVGGVLETTEGVGLAGKAVTLQSSGNGTDWTAVAATTTAVDGSYSLSSAALRSASYLKVTFGGDAEYGAAVSSALLVKPNVRLTRTTSWKTLYRGRTYYAKGYVEPYHATSNSNRIKIRAYKKGADNKYHYVRSFTANFVYYSKSKTAYKAPIRFTKASSKGSWKFVAYHATDSKNYKTYGTPDFVTVR